MVQLNPNKYYIAVMDGTIVGVGHTEGQIEQAVREDLGNPNIRFEDLEVHECTYNLFHEAFMERVTTSWIFNDENLADVEVIS